MSGLEYMVDVHEWAIGSTHVVFLGTEHLLLEDVIDVLDQYQPTIICAEAPPSVGLVDRGDQNAVQSYAKRTGAQVVLMDSDDRLSKQEVLKKYGEDALERFANAATRTEMKQAAPDLYHELVTSREHVMNQRIKNTLAQASSDETVAVVVGKDHLPALMP